MITNTIIVICLIIFIYINFISKDDKTSTAVRLGAFYPPYVMEEHQYFRFITCNFIHIDFFHFLMNAYALYDLGRFFEGLLGTVSYLFLVLISMLLSSLLTYTASQISERYYQTITIGASGIVFGFFGAICALAYLYGGGFVEIFEAFIPILAINVIFTIFHPRISKTGHLGGFIGGFTGIVLLMAMQLI